MKRKIKKNSPPTEFFGIADGQRILAPAGDWNISEILASPIYQAKKQKKETKAGITAKI